MYPATLNLNGKRNHGNPIYIGDTYIHEITFLDESNQPVSKSGVTILAQVRSSTDAASPAATFTSSVSGAGNNVVTLSLTAGVTGDLAPGTYVWDYQETAGSVVTTRLKGEVLIVKDVSRS